MSEGSLVLNPPPVSSTIPPWFYLGVEFKKKSNNTNGETVLSFLVLVREKGA